MFGVYYGEDKANNYKDSVTGIQEVNNAEIQAILHGLQTQQDVAEVIIISDSLNAVRFCTEQQHLSNHKIRQSKNSGTKLLIKKILRAREEAGARTSFKHIRSLSGLALQSCRRTGCRITEIFDIRSYCGH